MTEDKAKKERSNKIQNEVITSHKRNVEIDWNWQELEEKEDCKELDEVSRLFITKMFIGHASPNGCLQENYLRQGRFN